MGCLEEEGSIFDNDIINNGPEEYVMTWLALLWGGGGGAWGKGMGRHRFFYDFYL